MIFVTVGTDHHPFDRLIKAVVNLKSKGVIHEEVFIQTGTSGHPLQECRGEEFLSFDEMMDMIQKARMVITHGGPGSIMPVLRMGKMPVVMPREKRYGEAVDDHQIDFARRLQEKGRIILVRDPRGLEEAVRDFESFVKRMEASVDDGISAEQRLNSFVQKLDQACRRLVRNRA